MAIKIKLAMPTGNHPWTMLALRVALLGVAVSALVFAGVFSFYYFKYEGIVNARLKEPLFAQTAKIYATPREVRAGQKLSIDLIANELREAGYTSDDAAKASPLGTYSTGALSITVRPGPQSYHSEDSATIHIVKGQVQSITDEHGQPLASYELEPLLITGLSDANRIKRRLVSYDELPRISYTRWWPLKTVASSIMAASTTFACWARCATISHRGITTWRAAQR